MSDNYSGYGFGGLIQILDIDATERFQGYFQQDSIDTYDRYDGSKPWPSQKFLLQVLTLINFLVLKSRQRVK